MGNPFERKRTIFWVDNNSAVACLCKVCKAGAAEIDTRLLTKAIWTVVQDLAIPAWFEWVESKANLADTPSRMMLAPGAQGKSDAETLKILGFSKVQHVNLKGCA